MDTGFEHRFFSQRVLFRAGALAELPSFVRALGFERVLVLSTPEQRNDAERVASDAGCLAIGIFSKAAMHTPVDVSDQAAGVARDLTADCTIGIGGGSTIGLGKAIALRTGVPQIAVPTTYAGSECTPIIGETENGVKRTRRDSVVVPAGVLYDPELTLSLPARYSGLSGLNALAHAVEALYSPSASPLLCAVALEGVRALAGALPRIVRDTSDLDARADALYGAWLCGTCLGTAAMGLHHKICHVLGGSFDLPHAESHALVLPYVVAFNRTAAPGPIARLADALGDDDPAAALAALARTVDAPQSLAELGLRRADIDRVVDLLLEDAYWNPRPLERADLRELVLELYEGALHAARPLTT